MCTWCVSINSEQQQQGAHQWREGQRGVQTFWSWLAARSSSQRRAAQRVRAVYLWEMDSGYLGDKGSVGRAVRDNMAHWGKSSVTNSSSCARDRGGPQMLLQERKGVFILFIFFKYWNGKPVVSSGEFNSSGNPTRETGCLWNLWVSSKANKSNQILYVHFCWNCIV